MAELQKRNVRKYYKYKYSEWTQPIFGGNTISSNGITEYRCRGSHEAGPAWYAYNANLTADNCWWTKHGVTSETNPCWLMFYSRKKIKVTSIDIMNESSTSENFSNCYIQASNDDVNYITLAQVAGTNTASYHTIVDLNTTEPYHYYRLYFDASYSTGGVSLQTVTWYGQMLEEIQVSTEEDYDFYKDEVEYYAPIEDKEKYYIQDEYKRLRLYDTTNRSYIDANNHFIVDSVTAWSTIQTYTLEPNIIANKIRIRAMDSWVEANSGWIFVVMARCMDNSVHYRWLDWGYNVAPCGTHFVEFPSNNHIKQITIYAYCYRSSTSYCYGRIRVALDYTKLIETTKEKAIITKKDKEVIVNAIGTYRRPKQLAEGFLQLEHIQCNGNQYIFTDYYPKLPSTKIRYICEFMHTPDQCLWCARGATTTTLTNTMFKLAGGLRFDYNATSYQTSACRNTQYIYEIVQDGLSLYVNGVLKYTYAASTFNCDSPLQFFASYHAGIGANLGNYAFLKCYLIEIYEDNVLVRRYVPCERVIDKVYGLYDTVNNAFFSNSWSGYNFTRGDYVYEDSDVNDFTIYNSKAYFEATSV